MVVENRPGAGGNIGVDAVAKSAPDGHTIGLAAAGALSVNQSLYSTMPFDPQKDLAPISMLAMIPFLIVAHPSQPRDAGGGAGRREDEAGSPTAMAATARRCISPASSSR